MGSNFIARWIKSIYIKISLANKWKIPELKKRCVFKPKKRKKKAFGCKEYYYLQLQFLFVSFFLTNTIVASRVGVCKEKLKLQCESVNKLTYNSLCLCSTFIRKRKFRQNTRSVVRGIFRCSVKICLLIKNSVKIH